MFKRACFIGIIVLILLVSGCVQYGEKIKLSVDQKQIGENPTIPQAPNNVVNHICNPYYTYNNGDWYEGAIHSHVNVHITNFHNSVQSKIIDARLDYRDLDWAAAGDYDHGGGLGAQDGAYYPPGGSWPSGCSDRCDYECPYGHGNCQTTQPTNNPSVDWIYDWNLDGIFHHECGGEWNSKWDYHEGTGDPCGRYPSQAESVSIMYAAG